MADESIRSEPASLAKAAAQDDQEDRAAVSLRVLNVPAPMPATVDNANETVIDGQFHPEWGFLAPRRNFLGTIRVVLIASAIGALSGGGIVLWMEGGAPEDTGSVAARTLVPPRVEAPDKSSETTSSVLPPQQQRELPLEASELKTAETTHANREGETARSELDANLPTRRPLVQVETAEPRDYAPDASNGELGAKGSKKSAG